MNAIQESFVANLKLHRERRDLTQQEFAERCGLSQSFVADIERGKKFPSPASIEKICAALEIRPFELFLGPEDFSGVPGSEILTEDLLRLKDSITDAIGATLDRLVPR